MTTLKITDREAVLVKVLSDAFSPRFATIQKQLQGHLRARLSAEHPKFLKLLKDAESSKYIATGLVQKFYFVSEQVGEIRAASPKYGKRLSMPSAGYFDREDYVEIKDNDTRVPCGSLNVVKVTDEVMIRDYLSVWADYHAAGNKLKALLDSYAVREKFANDFPEFAKFLPQVETKPKLPMAIIQDVRNELSALGVPA